MALVSGSTASAWVVTHYMQKAASSQPISKIQQEIAECTDYLTHVHRSPEQLLYVEMAQIPMLHHTLRKIRKEHEQRFKNTFIEQHPKMSIFVGITGALAAAGGLQSLLRVPLKMR